MQLTLNNDELAFGVHSNVVLRVQTLGLAHPFDEPQRRAGPVALNEIAGAKLVLGNAELRERNQCLLSVPFLFPPGIQEPETAVFKATIVRHSTVPDEALEDVAARHRKGQGLARAERRKPQFRIRLRSLSGLPDSPANSQPAVGRCVQYSRNASPKNGGIGISRSFPFFVPPA